MKYLHFFANDCLDAAGNKVFEQNRRYTCTQVSEAGFCSYLQDGVFKCSKRLKDYDYKMCNEHFRSYNAKEARFEDKKPTNLPYYMREKNYKNTLSINNNEVVPNINFQLVEDEKISPSQRNAFDDETEQLIELLVLAIYNAV